MTHGARATARLFLAVDPPEEVCRELAGWARTTAAQAPGGAHQPPPQDRRERGGRERAGGSSKRERPPSAHRPELRVLPAQGQHITLCFLGSRPVEEIDILASIPASSTGEVGELSVGAPVWLPPRRPRALAVEIHDLEGELERLQHELVGMLARTIGWEPERRRFRAHLTVARLGGREPWPGAFAGAHPGPATPALRFLPQGVTLYRSWLSPTGTTYEALATRPLAPMP